MIDQTDATPQAGVVPGELNSRPLSCCPGVISMAVPLCYISKAATTAASPG